MVRSNEFECLKYIIDTCFCKTNGSIVFCNVDNNTELLKHLNEVKPNPHS